MLRNYFRPVVLLLALLFLTSGCNESSPVPNSVTVVETKTTTQPSLSDCTLTMGWDPWEPYTYWTPNNRVSGLDVEVITLIANEADCKIEFVQGEWGSLLSQLEFGEIDFVTGASITPKRRSFALFSDPYRAESFVLYVRSGEQKQFKGSIQAILEDGKKIGTTTDYIYGESVSTLQDDEKFSEQFIHSSVGEMNYYNLVQHNIDAFIEDPFVGSYNIKRKGINEDIEQLPIEIYSGNVHLMFSKKSTDPKIVERFNRALEEIKEDGRYSKILNKYLL